MWRDSLDTFGLRGGGVTNLGHSPENIFFDAFPKLKQF